MAWQQTSPRIELDAAAGRYRVANILRGQNQEEIYRSPLTEVGVDVKEGDYILAIDGQAFVPEAASGSAAGQWVIEGHGVDPDIVVENDAAAVIDGRDQQLERGIAEVVKAMQANPKVLPPRPPDPVKTPKH